MFKFLAVSAFVVAWILILAAALTGCGKSPMDLETENVVNDHGQTVTYVNSNQLQTWLKTNKHLRIVALTGYSRDSGTYGYVVIYETPRAEVGR